MKGVRSALLTALGLLGASIARPATIALVQYSGDAHFGDRQTNARNLRRHADRAVRDGASLIVFPEGALFGYDNGKDIWCAPGGGSRGDDPEGRRACRDVSKVAEPVPGGATTRYWKSFSAERGVYVVFNLVEIAAGRYYNTIVAVGPAGEVAKYRKRTLYDVDQAYASPGAGPAVLETPFGRFGLLICLDGIDAGDSDGNEELNFGYYEEYKKLGVDGILIPMNWANADPADPWSAKSVFEARARQNALDIFAADAWDGTGKYRSDGRPRERDGLGPGAEGVSYHRVAYRKAP